MSYLRHFFFALCIFFTQISYLWYFWFLPIFRASSTNFLLFENNYSSLDYKHPVGMKYGLKKLTQQLNSSRRDEIIVSCIISLFPHLFVFVDVFQLSVFFPDLHFARFTVELQFVNIFTMCQC